MTDGRANFWLRKVAMDRSSEDEGKMDLVNVVVFLVAVGVLLWLVNTCASGIRHVDAV
jgi:hypothetical protein